ncbi:hybrid sensor histidine kinase/response regulator [bacterium]|nr:hybrid sensor histidine kinase/response regulator [bacterium]
MTDKGTVDLDMKSKIKREIIDSAYQDFETIQYPAFPYLFLLFYTFYGCAETYPLAIWFCVSLGFHTLPFFVKKYYLRASNEEKSHGRWSRYIIIIAFLLGSAASLASIFALQKDLNTFYIIVFMLMLQVLAFSSFKHTKIYIAFASPICLMMTIVFFFKMEDDRIFSVFFLLILICFVLINIRFTKTLSESISIRFENIELIKKLQFQKEKAEQAVRDKSVFLSAANHDIRQPLQAARLYIATLKETDLTKEQALLFEKVSISLDDTNGLLESIMDISRIDAEIIKPDIKSFYADSLFSKLALRYKDLSNLKHIRFVKRNINNVCIQSDPILLERILDNILSNSLRYTVSGSIEMSIEIKENNVHINIIDTGVGIQKTDISHIFTPFYQGCNDNMPSLQGVGLGLAIVKSLCDLLGHSIIVKSEVGRGTMFQVTADTGNPNDMTESIEETIAFSEDISGVNILCVDDDVSIQDATSHLFNIWGCQSKVVGSIKEATTYIEGGFRPDIIVSDYRLQNSMTGVEAIEAINTKLTDRIPAILLTGDTDSSYLSKISQSAHPVLYKPINAGVLKNTIKSLLQD